MKDVEHIRAAQVECYIRDELAGYFALAAELEAASPGYARSYENWLRTVFLALDRAEPDVAFLQVGAMDGKRFDPVYAFVKHFGWRGLILEPLPDLFQALSDNYAGCGPVTLVPVALTERDGPAAMLRVDRDAAAMGHVPNWAEGLGSFFPERNALGGVGVGSGSALHQSLLAHSRRETVDCVTLATLLERHPLPRLDLLQVDAEGCELQILRQVDDHGFRPRVIHLEHWALEPTEKRALFGLLGERGYLLRMSDSDVLAVDPALKQRIDDELSWAS